MFLLTSDGKYSLANSFICCEFCLHQSKGPVKWELQILLWKLKKKRNLKYLNLKILPLNNAEYYTVHFFICALSSCRFSVLLGWQTRPLWVKCLQPEKLGQVALACQDACCNSRGGLNTEDFLQYKG